MRGMMKSPILYTLDINPISVYQMKKSFKKKLADMLKLEIFTVNKTSFLK
jgi:hypothetical protein